jgi:hypothetical protein
MLYSTQNENSARQNLLTNTTHKLVYRTMLTTLAQKRYDFDPLLTSSIKKASQKLQETAGKLKSLLVQRAIKLCERIKIQQETTVL